MKKSLLFTVLYIFLFLGITDATLPLWGTKQGIPCEASVQFIPSNSAQKITIYNAGTADVAFAINCSQVAFDAGYSNNIVPIVAALQPVNLDYSSYNPKSGQLNKITNILLRASAGTQTVYIIAY